MIVLTKTGKLKRQTNLDPLHGACGGRLTTETGVPVSTGNRTNQYTLYFTPDPASQFCGQISLFDGGEWLLTNFNELSLVLSAVSSGQVYDVFVYLNGGVPTLELSAAWTATGPGVRADALTTQDNVLVKSGSPTRRYIGTIRGYDDDRIADHSGYRYLWNMYNRVWKEIYYATSADSSYKTSTWRYYLGSSGYSAKMVVGMPDIYFFAVVSGYRKVHHNLGAGLNSSTPFRSAGIWTGSNTDLLRHSFNAAAPENFRLGYNYVAICEYGYNYSQCYCYDARLQGYFPG